MRDYSGTWHQSLISLLVKSPTLSFKDFYIHFIQKNYKHDNSRNVYSTLAFLTLLWLLTSSVNTLCPSLLTKKSKPSAKASGEEIPVCLKGKLSYLTLFDTYFFSKKLPFQQAAEDSIWTTLLFAAGRQKKTEREGINRCSVNLFSYLPFLLWETTSRSSHHSKAKWLTQDHITLLFQRREVSTAAFPPILPFS